MKNPINYSLKTEIWPLLVLLAAIGLSVWSYPLLPAQVVTHWDFYGRPNGWNSREFHAIFFPALLVAMYALFSLMPKFDPRGKRYQEFAGVYRMMRNMILLALTAVFAAATLANLGYAVNIGATVAGVIGVMMIVLGNYFGKLKRNYFIGLRTPWTISSENVWNKTHRLGGRLFMIWGLCLIVSPWLAAKAAFLILIGGLIMIIFGVTIYSYLLFGQEKRHSGKDVL